MNVNTTTRTSTTLPVNESPSFGEALKQSWSNTFAKSKVLGALRVIANLTVIGAIIDLAASGIAHSLGKLGRNAQPIPPTRLSQTLDNPPSPRDVSGTFSGSSRVDKSSSPPSPSRTEAPTWTPTKTLSLNKRNLETPGVLCPPSRPQVGMHALHTQAFKAFFDAGVSFDVPGKVSGDNVKNGKVTINGKEYDYSANAKIAKGSGAGIWMIKLTDSSGEGTSTEFVIKATPKKGDESDLDMGDYYRQLRQKDVGEVQVLDLMSGNDRALHFHGGYSLPDGTLVYGMEKAGGDMSDIGESRMESAKKGTLDPGGEDQHILQMAKALTDLHACGQVHGDIKSDNFMLGTDGTARIADFGECYVTDQQVRQETLKGDVHRFATMAYNLRHGVKEKTDDLAGTIRKHQEKLLEPVTIKVSEAINHQKELIKQMEESGGGDLETINLLKSQLRGLEDPSTAVETLVALSGKDLDESVRAYAINQLLLEAINTTAPDFNYMAGFTRQLARLVA